MTSDAETLYKLIILYTLDRINGPLTNAQVCDMMIDLGYTNYFSVQQVLSVMSEDDLINVEIVYHSTRYTITEKGLEMIRLFENHISNGIRTEVDLYLKENALEIRRVTSQSADYKRNEFGEYTVTCCTREKDHTLLSLSFSVPDEVTAGTICRHWSEKSSEVYETLLKTLL